MKWLVAALCLCALNSGFTADTKGQAKISERQEQMAKMHENMASCLRSGKTPPECHSKVMADCPMMKDGECPMMQEAGFGSGKGKGRGMMQLNQ